MQNDNTVQIGVVMARISAKPITVWIFSEKAADVSLGILRKTLNRKSCQEDPEELMSKLILEMVDHHYSNNLGIDNFRVGVQMYVNVNQMFIVDTLNQVVQSTSMGNRFGNFKLGFEEFINNFESKARL